jgi:hypothetical protein
MKRFSPLILAAVLGAASLGANAQSVPKLINYQGRLTKADGKTPIDDGTYGVQFRLWNKPLPTDAGNQLVWGAEYQVALLDGQFNVILGAPGGTVISGGGVNDLSFAFGDGERFLGLTISKDKSGAAVSSAQEILPRQQLLSVPYALQAASVADGAITSAKLAQRIVSTNAPAGGIAVSTNVSWQSQRNVGEVAIPGLSVRLHTTGRPVLIMLVPDTQEQRGDPSEKVPGKSYLYGQRSVPETAARVILNLYGGTGGTKYLCQTIIEDQQPNSPSLTMWAPPLFQTVDFPIAGDQVYSFKAYIANGHILDVSNVRLVAFEL